MFLGVIKIAEASQLLRICSFSTTFCCSWSQARAWMDASGVWLTLNVFTYSLREQYLFSCERNEEEWKTTGN